MSKNWAVPERAELCDLLRQLGPDAPTLCGDWRTRDLAAHLALREARPDGAAGIVLPLFASHTERLQRKYAQRDYEQLVSEIASGPPTLSAFRLPGADAMLNTTEYFVHYEDVRRAQPDWQPRDLPQSFRDALWNIVKSRGPALMRKSPVGIDVVRTDAQEPQMTTVRAREPRIRLTGEAPELLLYAFGRKDHCRVELDGDADAVASVLHADFSV